MDALEQQKIQVMIDLATQTLRTEVNQLRDQLSNLKSEMGDVRKKAMTAGTRITQEPQPVTQSVPEQPQQTFSKPAQAAANSQPSSQPIDRNGVAPEEVSIEKMFYFGNKRF